MPITSSSIYILQLNRIGDVFQTLAAISQLHANTTAPSKINLIVRSEMVPLIPNDLVSRFNIIVSSFEELCNLNQSDKSIFINLSFCETSSRFLKSLQGMGHTIFGRIEEANQPAIYGQWFKYIYGVIQTCHYNPFNLVDLFRYCIIESLGIDAVIPVNQVDYLNEGYEQIILHPFASNNKKAFKSKKWTDILNNLNTTKRIKVHIVGSRTDQPAADEILKDITNKNIEMIDHVGKSSFQELLSLCTDRTMFVGHDSSVGHLLSFSGAYQVTIALGYGRIYENSPIGPGLILTPTTKCFPCHQDTPCDYYQCHYDVSSISMANCLADLIQGKYCSSEYPHLRTLKKVQNQGFQFLIPVNCSNTFDEVFQQMYFLTFGLFLGNFDINVNPALPNIEEIKKLHPQVEGIQIIYELATFGRKYCKFIFNESIKENPSMEKINEFNEKIVEIDKYLEQMRTRYAPLTPIINWYFVNQANIKGQTITQLTLNSDNCYMELELMCSTMHELLNSIIKKIVPGNKTALEK